MSTDAERAYEQHFAECTICYARGVDKGWCVRGFKLWLAAREAQRGYLLPATRKWLCSSCGREIDGPGLCDRCSDARQQEIRELYDVSKMCAAAGRAFPQRVRQVKH